MAKKYCKQISSHSPTEKEKMEDEKQIQETVTKEDSRVKERQGTLVLYIMCECARQISARGFITAH